MRERTSSSHAIEARDHSTRSRAVRRWLMTCQSVLPSSKGPSERPGSRSKVLSIAYRELKDGLIYYVVV